MVGLTGKAHFLVVSFHGAWISGIFLSVAPTCFFAFGEVWGAWDPDEGCIHSPPTPQPCAIEEGAVPLSLEDEGRADC